MSALECAGLLFQQEFNILKIQVLPHLQTLELWWRLWISQAGIGQDPYWLTEAGGELLVSHLLSRKAKLPWSEWRTLTTKEKRLKPGIKQLQNTTDFVSIALGIGLTILPGFTEAWSVGRCTVLRCYLFSKSKQVQWEDNSAQKSPISRCQVTIWWLQQLITESSAVTSLSPWQGYILAMTYYDSDLSTYITAILDSFTSMWQISHSSLLCLIFTKSFFVSKQVSSSCSYSLVQQLVCI